MSESFKID